jgi:glycosyltransferase involved in cell wall biosynthesis
MKKFGCVVAFFPGGTLPLVSTLPAVVMSQNMLPFELGKAKIFGIYSLMFLKLCALRLLQKNSLRRASGIIFLSKYAQNKINDDVKLPALQALIPHGIEKRFISYPKVQKSIENYSIEKPFRFLYVSILMPYKHQVEVIRAIKLLRARGFPIVCQLVGSSWGWYGEAVLSEIKKLDPENIFLDYRSEIPFDQLHNYYHKSDGFIFASSCENLPNILIEAMASGLPVACSSMGPMPEILGSDGFYFDPTSTPTIEKILEELILSIDKRTEYAVNANQKAKLYSWQVCANRTFELLKLIKNEKY